ncbi:MAG: hypothetical protein ACJA0W_000345 [Candidatus Azotimanducaceae bacterium]
MFCKCHLIIGFVYTDMTLTTNIHTPVQFLLRKMFLESVPTMHFFGYQVMERQRQPTFTARTLIDHSDLLLTK